MGTDGKSLALFQGSAEPAANSPEDLGWTAQAVTRPRRPTVTYAIPPKAPRRSCTSCAAPIFWIVTPAGRRMPVDPDGTSHFATCPDAKQHRQPR